MTVAHASLEFADMFDEEKRAVDEWLVGALGLRPEDRVLEVACGTAGTGLAIAPLLRYPGRVLCTDRSPEMLDLARAVAARRAIANVDFRLMDAERLELEDDSVDAVVCRLGFPVMDAPAAALAETRRVLRPGGRLALAVWSESEHNPWQSIPDAAMGVERALYGSWGARPGPFALADPDLLRRLLGEAGFADVRLERVQAVQRYESAEQFWAICVRMSRSVCRALAKLAPAERAATKRWVLDRLDERRASGDGFAVPAQLLVAVGVAVPQPARAPRRMPCTVAT